MNIDTKTSYWIILFTAFFVAVGVMLNANQELKRLDEFSVAPPPSLPQSAEAKIELDFNNGARRMFVAELASVYRLTLALQSVAEEGEFTYRIKEGNIEELAGVKGDWKIYKNGDPQTLPIDRLIIENGDHYIFRAE